MLHPLMPREKREMDLRTGRRDDKFRGRNFCRSLYGSWPINGLGPRFAFRVAKKVRRFCLLMKFSSRSSGTVRKHGEMKRERERFVGNSLVVTSWSLLNVVIVSCALRFLEFYFSFFTIVLGIFITDKCLN